MNHWLPEMEVEIETNQKPFRKYSVPIFNHRPKPPKKVTTESEIINQSKTTEFETIESKNDQYKQKEKPFKCDICNKSFNSSYYIKYHKRIHTDERPYKCDVCNKSFKWSNLLKVHKLNHTDERAYKCQVCKKAFKRSDLLKVHLQIHTDQRPFKCNRCNKSFKFLSSLCRHRIIHRNN